MFGDKYRASENMGLERTILLLLTFGEEHRRRDNRPNDGPISERADWEEKVLGFGGGGRAVFLAPDLIDTIRLDWPLPTHPPTLQ